MREAHGTSYYYQPASESALNLELMRRIDVQFTAQPFTQRLLAANVRISMDGRGRALDNIFVERL